MIREEALFKMNYEFLKPILEDMSVHEFVTLFKLGIESVEEYSRLNPEDQELCDAVAKRYRAKIEYLTGD